MIDPLLTNMMDFFLRAIVASGLIGLKDFK